MTELPELPMPDGAILARDGERATVFDGGYTADQMRAYALKERAAERERCASVCRQVYKDTGVSPELALYCAGRIEGQP